jgi:hypothetical protein
MMLMLFIHKVLLAKLKMNELSICLQNVKG